MQNKNKKYKIRSSHNTNSHQLNFNYTQTSQQYQLKFKTISIPPVSKRQHSSLTYKHNQFKFLTILKSINKKSLILMNSTSNAYSKSDRFTKIATKPLTSTNQSKSLHLFNHHLLYSPNKK